MDAKSIKEFKARKTNQFYLSAIQICIFWMFIFQQFNIKTIGRQPLIVIVIVIKCGLYLYKMQALYKMPAFT